MPGHSRGYVPNTQLRQVIQELCGFPVQREDVLALHVLHRLVQLRHLRNNSCSFRCVGSCRMRTINYSHTENQGEDKVVVRGDD
ncbi:unnamed protein product [Ectocarpus sp. 6 AP-2014]